MTDGVKEEQIAEKLAELEPAWAGRPNLFDKQIAARDVKTLLSRLDDQLPGVRAAAAEALGRLKCLKEVSATARLKALLSDPEPSVRRSAAVGLASLGDEAISKEFVKALLAPSAKAVAGAAEALGLSGYKAAVPYLLKLLKAYRTDLPRVALGDSGGTRGLCDALSHESPPVRAPVRAAAARSLGQLARTGNFDFVLKDSHRLIADPDPRKQKLQQHLSS